MIEILIFIFFITSYVKHRTSDISKTLIHKILITSYIVLLASYISNAQWYDPAKVDHNANTMYSLALNKAQNDEYPTAIRMINEALKIEPKFVDAYLSLAGISANMKNYTESVNRFEKAFSLDSIYTYNYLLPYSISLAGNGRFSDALNAINKFLLDTTINDRSRKAALFRKGTYQFAIDYANAHPDKNYIFKPENLGDSINTTDLEYFPSLTIDGKKMIFTKRIKGNEDFYESDLHSNGMWGKAYSLPGNINSSTFNEGAQNISQDGKWLIFTGCNFPT
jgi:tetratricopeptide (TPR) repeat protein